MKKVTFSEKPKTRSSRGVAQEGEMVSIFILSYEEIRSTEELRSRGISSFNNIMLNFKAHYLEHFVIFFRPPVLRKDYLERQ